MLCYKYIFRRSLGDVMRLHCGHSFFAPRVRSQHSSQCTCQHCTDTNGLLYLSIHMRHRNGVLSIDATESSTITKIVIKVDGLSGAFGCGYTLQSLGR